MKLAGAEIARFSLPLRRPLRGSGFDLRERTGFLLRLRSAAGAAGLGEASPAAWVGGESLAETEAALRAIVARVRRGDEELSEATGSRFADPPPAARSALDCALLDLEARERGTTVAAMLGAIGHAKVRLSALLFAEAADDLSREIDEALATGFRDFKLKVGASARDDLARVASVRRAAGPQAAIRLDANRAWTLEEARRRLDDLARFAPAMIEEPLRSADPLEWRRLREATAVPLAADESIADGAALERLVETRAVDVVVLKLARLGGARPALAMARRARRAGVGIVFTDSLESAVGRSAVVHAAAALGTEIPAIGLGGAGLFARDVGHGLEDGSSAEARGPGLGVELDADFEQSLYWHE